MIVGANNRRVKYLNPFLKFKKKFEFYSRDYFSYLFNFKIIKFISSETLRMQGPVPFLIRAASNSYRVPNSNIVIEKGSQAIIPVYAIHNDPENYPEPSKFDPERFSEENKAKRHPMAFIPFGDGPR
jgi:cytochrome P450 family 6